MANETTAALVYTISLSVSLGGASPGVTVVWDARPCTGLCILCTEAVRILHYLSCVEKKKRKSECVMSCRFAYNVYMRRHAVKSQN